MTKFRCIDDSTEVHVEPEATAIVGRNESGKTAFLEAVRRLNPIDGATFDMVHDYPRTQLAAYRPYHAADPDIAVTARFDLEDEDLREVERRFGRGVFRSKTITVKRDYQNRLQVAGDLDESALVRGLLAARPDVQDEAKAAAEQAKTAAELVTALEPFAEAHAGAKALIGVAQKLAEGSLLSRIWKDVLAARFPRFMLFGELDTVPSAIAFTRLREANAMRDAGVATALALLDVAGLSVDDLDPDAQSFEELRARIENAAQGVTDELRTFWTQDQDLEVLVDVATASSKDVEFTPGEPVLRIRIAGKKDRVSLPVSERSRGFNWFFSFLVRLAHLANNATSLVILLDEPGRSLHAVAQADFLRFVEQRLAPDHQLIFATHSPYLLQPGQLSGVRVVTRKGKRGTIVTSDLGSADEESLKPLRASVSGAMGRALVPSGPTLIVRDPSDLMWLRGFSEQVAKRKKGGLDPRWAIVPVGNADGLVELAIAAGYAGRNAVALFEPTPGEAWQIARLAATRLVDSSRFVSLASITKGEGPASCLEDFFDVQWWLALVREAYRLDVINDGELASEGPLPERTRALLTGRGVAFDRLTVADLGLRRLGSSPIPPATIDRFARLFEVLNAFLPANG